MTGKELAMLHFREDAIRTCAKATKRNYVSLSYSTGVPFPNRKFIFNATLLYYGFLLAVRVLASI